MRCRQKQSNYPEFTCSAVATFWVRWVNRDKELKGTYTCAQHLSKACRNGFEDVHSDYESVQVKDLREEEK